MAITNMNGGAMPRWIGGDGMADRIQYNDDGSLDEVVAGGAHLEHMGGKGWFLSMQRADGSSFCIWINGRITSFEDRDAPKATP